MARRSKAHADHAQASVWHHQEISGNKADGKGDKDVAIVDLLADLKHLAAREGLEWPELERRAENHFTSEAH